MASKYKAKDQNSEPNRKPKYNEKGKAKGRFNFNWDEESITFKTFIPEVPSKLKTKPDPKAHEKKV